MGGKEVKTKGTKMHVEISPQTMKIYHAEKPSVKIYFVHTRLPLTSTGALLQIEQNVILYPQIAKLKNVSLSFSHREITKLNSSRLFPHPHPSTPVLNGCTTHCCSYHLLLSLSCTSSASCLK